jgi:hypothetical protein
MEQNGNSAKDVEQSQHLQDASRSTLRRLLSNIINLYKIH